MILAVNLSWLERLGLMDAPEGTSLQSATLSLRGLLPWWLAVLLLLAGAGGATWFYARENARLGAARRGLLAMLRIVTGLRFPPRGAQYKRAANGGARRRVQSRLCRPLAAPRRPAPPFAAIRRRR